MAACSAAIGALSTFYPDSLDPRNERQIEVSTHRLIAKMPMIAAALLILNGRTDWVGARYRNRWWTALTLLGILIFFAAIGYGLWQSWSRRSASGGTPQWPDPSSGRRPWWQFWKKKGSKVSSSEDTQDTEIGVDTDFSGLIEGNEETDDKKKKKKKKKIDISFGSKNKEDKKKNKDKAEDDW